MALAGKVVDPTGNPLSGVQVKMLVSKRIDTTDAQGIFTISTASVIGQARPLQDPAAIYSMSEIGLFENYDFKGACLTSRQKDHSPFAIRIVRSVPRQPSLPLFKSSAPMDTLQASLHGWVSVNFPVDSFNQTGIRIAMTALDHIVRAFPTAEGHGAMAKGGRGGIVVEVTNLNDAGSGSLRAALMMTVPRTIVFKTGGTITLASRITMGSANSFVTVAGQTAPGGGIQIKGFDISLESGNHDAVFRFIKFRPGHTDASEWSKQGFLLSGAKSQVVKDVILDHCSIYWGPDDNICVWDYVENFTAQWCISEGMVHDVGPRFENAKGAIFGSDADRESVKNMTLHHCYFVNCAQRSPLIAALGPFQLVNNVTYNWVDFGTQIDNWATGVKVNLIGNYYKRGPATNTHRYAIGLDGNANPDAYVYVRDNIGPFRTLPTMDDWAIIGIGATSGYWTTPADIKYRKPTPWAASHIPVSVDSSASVVARVLAEAGSTKKLDSHGLLIDNRDALDSRAVADYSANTGTIRKASAFNQNWYPVLATGTAYIDTDHDGMADYWEQARFGSLVRNGAEDIDGDGYTDLEDFLNGTKPFQ
jgi:pectate lyase